MSPFRFRLETLLRMRLMERDQRRAELAKALRAEALLRQQQHALRVDRAQLVGQSRQLKAPGTANVEALLHTHRYELVLVAQERQLSAQLVQIEAETERRRLLLVEADRQVRVLEKLRDRQSLAWRQQDERLQTKQFDEMAVLGFVRQQEDQR
jgi:flagellar FliJ protein